MKNKESMRGEPTISPSALSSRLGQGAVLGKNIGIHIGIPLVRGLSNFIDYRYTVGLNNLLIKL
ncbi:MAG: hypothetical protein RR685_00480 [Hungatella sp.]